MPRQRMGPIKNTIGWSAMRYINAPNEVLAHIAERIEKRIFTDRTNEETCILLAAAYREIIHQRRVVQRYAKLVTQATQTSLLEE